jgi:hypothetical protein
MCPIYEKGIEKQKNRVQNYREIILLNTGYKLYASVLSERMKIEIEEKGVVPHSQARFSRGKGHYGQCVHSGPSSKERTEEERGEDVRTVRRLQGGVRQGWQRENVCVYERERNKQMRNVEEIYARTKSKVKVGEKEHPLGLR